MTTGEPLIRVSEYGKSYTCLNSCRDEYYDRLQFRIRKRNSEYSHHPFLWDDLECLSSSTSNLSVHEDVEVIRKDVPIKTLSISEDGHLDNLAEVEGPHDFTHVNEKNNAISTTERTDVGTQTQKPHLRAIVQPKAFVPYAIGSSPGPTLGARKTFNVKSDRDVYPSAIRAEARRKERLINFTNTNTVNSKVSSKMCGPKQCIVKSEAIELSKTEKPVPTLHKSTRVSSMPQPSGLGASYSRSNNNIDWKPKYSWVSEYVQKYPSYPTSVYVRSASVAAGRSRPLCFSYSRPSSSFLGSLVPSTPVLLSCRGSNSTLRSRRETHCDICSTSNLNQKCSRPLLSAY
ncbi:uncharacterized protein DC041_0007927 [Schistosoma bovis]|uniref:Uncharacterized protein n=1 Tax=Schistosoma bovis TaxID=6184 RepID=A0A430QE97_SCHBO|nr:uncharacterized protein DC041_0007927 [Schistosoma bovis]